MQKISTCLWFDNQTDYPIHPGRTNAGSRSGTFRTGDEGNVENG